MKPLNVVKSLCCVAIIGAAVPAASLAEDGLYVGVHAGANFKPAVHGNLEGPGRKDSFSLSSHPGFMVGGTLGYRWATGVRVEGEITYRRVANDDVSVGSNSGDINGNQDSIAFMLNGLYDFKLTDRWRPYLGVGIGLSVNGLTVTSLGTPKFDFVNDSSAAFAYQGIAGVDYNLTNNLSLGLQYKVFGTTGVDYRFKQAAETKAAADPQFDHSVVLTIKMHFGNGGN